MNFLEVRWVHLLSSLGLGTGHRLCVIQGVCARSLWTELGATVQELPYIVDEFPDAFLDEWPDAFLDELMSC